MGVPPHQTAFIRTETLLFRSDYVNKRVSALLAAITLSLKTNFDTGAAKVIPATK